MKNDLGVCLGCMNDIKNPEGVCPVCGFSVNQYEANPRALPLMTELHWRYKTGRVIGEGGFGITYIAWDKVDNKPVAIKEYFPSNVASRDCTNGGSKEIHFFDSKSEEVYKSGFEKYTEEADVLQRFNNLPGIVSTLDFFKENNTAYIVMEYIDGVTLKEYLEMNGALSAQETVEMMLPVMESLEHIHSQGVIHRDISPDNIMISMNGGFKLIDFGAARLTNDESGKSLTIILKRGYAPEEQYRTRGAQGPWTDVYALCATMYKMITNKVPPESMERVVSDDIKKIGTYPIDIPANYARAIMKGLQVKAEDRFHSVQELLDCLKGIEADVVKTRHLIAVFKDSSGEVCGYRLYDYDNNEFTDISAEDLIKYVSNGRIKVENIVIYSGIVAAVGGSLANYTVLDIFDKPLDKESSYYMEHTLAKGYLMINYKGQRHYYNEMEMHDMLENGQVANDQKLKLFISKREQYARNFVPANEPEIRTINLPKPTTVTTELRNQEKDKAEPVKRKLSLKTDGDNRVVGGSNRASAASAGSLSRLRMANTTSLTEASKQYDGEKRKKW